MYKVSELLGKPLISVNDAQITGTISNIFFNEKLSTGMYVSVINDDFNTAVIPLKYIVNSDYDAAVVKDFKTADNPDLMTGPINLFAFNQDGKELGIIKDVIMEGVNVIELVTDNGKFPSSRVLSRSESLVIINDTDAPVRAKKKKPAKASAKARADRRGKNESQDFSSKNSMLPPVSADNSVAFPFSSQIFDGETLYTPLTASKEGGYRNDEKIELPAIPRNTYVNPPSSGEGYDYKFLLNKRLQKTILGAQGQPIAKENALVTQEIIDRARKAGKLVQLALHSL